MVNTFRNTVSRIGTQGVVMFALMFSFAIFYSMSGMDFTDPSVKQEFTTSVPSTSPVFQSRAILSTEDSSRMNYEATTGGAVIAPLSPSSSARSPSPPPYMDSYAIVRKEEPVTPVNYIAPSTPRNDEIDEPVDMIVIKSEPVISESDAKAVDLYLYDDERKEVVDTTPAIPSDFELFQQWKKMVVDANLTLDMGTSYMFCPRAIQVRPTTPIVHKKEESPVQARLRRAGLPLPNGTTVEVEEDLNAARLTRGNNKLKLWLPTTAVMAGGDWDTAGYGHSAPFTEVECLVNEVRAVPPQKVTTHS